MSKEKDYSKEPLHFKVAYFSGRIVGELELILYDVLDFLDDKWDLFSNVSKTENKSKTKTTSSKK